MGTIQALIIIGITLMSGLFRPISKPIRTPVATVPDPRALSPSQSVTPTVSPTPTPTSIPAPTSTPVSTATPKPEPTPTPVPMPSYTSEQINHLIDQFASHYSVDSNILRHIALCESGFNPLANNLNYGGLFQFSPGSWVTYRGLIQKDPNPSLRFDASEAIQTAAYALSIGRISMWPTCSQNTTK